MTNNQAIDAAADKSATNYTAAYNELDLFMETHRSEWNLCPLKMRNQLCLKLAAKFWDNASESTLQAFDSWSEVVSIMRAPKVW